MTPSHPPAAVCSVIGGGPDGRLSPADEARIRDLLGAAGWQAPWGPTPAWAEDCPGLIQWLPGTAESLGSMASPVVKAVHSACPGVHLVIVDASGRSWFTPRPVPASAPASSRG
jgi:hypothetical protein